MSNQELKHPINELPWATGCETKVCGNRNRLATTSDGLFFAHAMSRYRVGIHISLEENNADTL